MSQRSEIISGKPPNISFSRDFAKLWKTRDFQQNLQTRVFHKIFLAAKKRDFQEISKHEPFTRHYKAVKKNPAIFKHISSKTRGFHEIKPETPARHQISKHEPFPSFLPGGGKLSILMSQQFCLRWLEDGPSSENWANKELFTTCTGSFWTEIYLFKLTGTFKTMLQFCLYFKYFLDGIIFCLKIVKVNIYFLT